MDAQSLHVVARAIALEQPLSTLEHPFGPEWDVMKVAGLVFCLLTVEPGRAIVTVKAEPPECEALCQEFASIAPGYHMNKRHWVSVAAGEGVDDALVRELVVGSYRLVVGKLPRARRPIDPATYGVAPTNGVSPA